MDEARAREVLAKRIDAVTSDGHGNMIRYLPWDDLSWMQQAAISAMLAFSAEAVAAEREACADLVTRFPFGSSVHKGAVVARDLQIADAIRARGNGTPPTSTIDAPE